MKYKLLLDDTKIIGSTTLYRIQALKDFGNVKANDKGGYIASEKNLSQEDNAWVYGNAQVYGNAWVSGNAQVFGTCVIKEDLHITKTDDIINISQLRYNITVSKTYIFIGCKVYKDFKDFLSKADADGRENGYTDFEIKYIKNIVKNTQYFLNKRGEK